MGMFPEGHTHTAIPADMTSQNPPAHGTGQAENTGTRQLQT